jgi:hypothetical protein
VPDNAKPAPNGIANSTHGTASSDGSVAPAAGSVLTGRVIRADGTGPFAGARVTVLGSNESTVSNTSGEFALHDLQAGSRTLAVRAIGGVTPRSTGSMIVTTQGPPPPPGGFRDSRIMASSNVTEALAQIATQNSGSVRGTGCVKIVIWTKIGLGLP